MDELALHIRALVSCPFNSPHPRLGRFGWRTCFDLDGQIAWQQLRLSNGEVMISQRSIHLSAWESIHPVVGLQSCLQHNNLHSEPDGCWPSGFDSSPSAWGPPRRHCRRPGISVRSPLWARLLSVGPTMDASSVAINSPGKIFFLSLRLEVVACAFVIV